MDLIDTYRLLDFPWHVRYLTACSSASGEVFCAIVSELIFPLY